MLIQELMTVLDREGWISQAAMREISARCKVPLHSVHEVASYYPVFRRSPPPDVSISVCRDMACHLRGAQDLQARLESLSQASPEKLTIEVTPVSCLGLCDTAPALLHQHHQVQFSPDCLETLLQPGKLPEALIDTSPLPWKIEIYQGPSEYRLVQNYLKDPNPARLLKELETADLRGMGGAGFRTHLKWSAVRQAPGEMKYVICNADESEPGTFKDRELLRRAPHLMIEGMILAALVTGAGRGIIYIRHEYDREAELIRQELSRVRELGLLGSVKVPFEIELYISPGGYIQGEETALLEALEDRRGEPRHKPPFPTTHGLYGCPTVINNVETLAWVPSILERGGAWYRNQGVRGATGLRLVSVSGDVVRPGVYEVPFGQTVGELLEHCGGILDGAELLAIAPSGPSGGFLPARLSSGEFPKIRDLPLDHNRVSAAGSMLGGAFFVVGSNSDLASLVRNCVEFFRNESCGKCVPCRVGSSKLSDLLARTPADLVSPSDRTIAEEISRTMSATSICGLGQVAANPLTSYWRHFSATLNSGATGSASAARQADDQAQADPQGDPR